MLGLKTSSNRANKDEAEKPFWISFSDLMTALMVLFLVAMAVALLAVTAPAVKGNNEQRERMTAIQSCLADLQAVTQAYPGVVLRQQSIDFGVLANFQNNSSALTQTQQEFLRQFVPRVLTISRQSVCQAWLKRVVVEGFASQGGTYLYNMNLSTQRSERVLCALLDTDVSDPMSEEDRRMIQSLFSVGGYSTSTIRKTPEESRRIELTLEFYALREPEEIPPSPTNLDEYASCPIGSR
jgi:outer membrane protein OmpA-like peptidoglycan-associated protein